jgi:hypothetical protein
MKITAHEIESLAPNAVAAKNGKDLVLKNKFSNLKISINGSVIWGECAGSGVRSYFCSADYTGEGGPVFRCTCPSVQFPCRHGIGLLYAFAKGLQFTVAEIPDEIVNRREKTVKRTEKKKSVQSEKPKNTKSTVKKTAIQLSGIETAKKLLQNIVQTGLSGIDITARMTLEEQIRELGNYHIEGIQLAFNNLLVELDYVEKDEYTDVINQLNYISALLKKSGEYLAAKKENPEMLPELSSPIEEQIGYVWKLADLKKYGMYEKNAEIIQLSYDTCDNSARKAFVDEAYWFNLKTGKIYRSKNYRPYKALRYIKEEDSCFEILKVPELFIYPGDANPRVRWDSVTRRPAVAADYAKIIDSSLSDYAETVKTVKSAVKNPLTDKNPVVLLKLHRAYNAGEHVVLEDVQGNKLTAGNMPDKYIDTLATLKSILPEKCENIALTAMIHNDIRTGMYYVTALSLVAASKIIRLLY